MKVALVYDRVNKFGGAERVLLALHKIWPDAPLYTSVYYPQRAKWAKNFRVISSFGQNFPLAKKYHEFYFWLMPFIFESFNFDNFDVVISITSAEAKGIITKPGTLHICYCLTPTRYLWSGFQEYLNNLKGGLRIFPIKKMIAFLFNNLRKWDKVACYRPDYYLAISKTVQQRIKKYYNQECEVVYPPVASDIFNFDLGKNKKNNLSFTSSYFLVVSRLVSYKRIDLIIEAFNKLGYPLKIIGDGWERKYLERKAKPNIEFLGGNLTNKDLLRYYQNCSALIVAGEEDFGLAAVEAQCCGKPVIAYKKGGLTEIILEGKTGWFFYPQTSEALIKAVKNFKFGRIKEEDCVKNGQRFKEENFLKIFKLKVEEIWKNYQQKLK